MPATSTWALPYPADADPVDVPGDLQALAEAVDADLTTVNAAASTAGFNPFFLIGA